MSVPETMGTNTARLAALGLALPAVSAATTSYVPAVRHGDLIIVSGQLPSVDGVLLATGPVGQGGHDVPAAIELARVCALNVLAAGAVLAGGLDRIGSILRVGVFVASAQGFDQQHLVADAASQVFMAVLGEGSMHARTSIGVPSLPRSAPVEVEAMLTLAG